MEIKDQVTQLVKQCEAGAFEELRGQDQSTLSGVFQSLTRIWGRDRMKREIPRVTYLQMVVANSANVTDRGLDQRIARALTIG